jgi:signal transduction histidine kinase
MGKNSLWAARASSKRGWIARSRRNGLCVAPHAAMSPSRIAARQRRARSSLIVAWMVVAIALLGVITYWDEQKAAAAALADFGAEQAMVARAAGGSLRLALEDLAHVRNDETVAQDLGTRVHALEQPGNVIVLIRRPGRSGFLTVNGDTLTSPPIEARFAAGHADASWVRLTHPESIALGLPPRTAIAGLSEVDEGADGTWGIAVVATARRERDREERGLWRVALGFVIASGIVVTFGTLALRTQRKEFEMAQRLAFAEAELARDERLVRADKLATLGAMAMGIAHQVATPLGVIVARAGRLTARVAEDEKARRAVAMIEEQAQRINEIIHAFLSLARGATPALENAEAGDIARAAVDFVAHRFEKAGVEIRYSIEDELPKIACDPRLLEQAIVNLLLNGCDACKRRGQVVLDVRSENGSVVFAVDDDGVGITAEAASRAAEPFFTTKPPGEGTGLGLAIVKEIVHHHRGTLSVAPLPRRGTRALVKVPAAPDEATS